MAALTLDPLRTAARDAARFWEPRRLVYNGVLVAHALSAFARQWPHSKSWFEPPASSFLIESAIILNIFFCAAYGAEFAIWLSPFGEGWRKWRPAVFILGLLLGSAFATMILILIAIGPMSN